MAPRRRRGACLLALALLPSCGALKAEEEGPKYAVRLMTGALNKASGLTADRPSIVMTKKGGKRYRCYLPTTANGTAVEESEASQRLPHIGSVLSSLRGACFYRLEGWWTYEFCFMKSLRQYHQEKAKGAKRGEAAATTQDYTLGAYWLPPKTREDELGLRKPIQGEAEAEWRGETIEDTKAKRKVWRHFYGNGTRCDLTGKPRETEVRVHCAPNEPSHIASVDEVSTCRYVAQARAPLLT